MYKIFRFLFILLSTVFLKWIFHDFLLVTLLVLFLIYDFCCFKLLPKFSLLISEIILVISNVSRLITFVPDFSFSQSAFISNFLSFDFFGFRDVWYFIHFWFPKWNFWFLKMFDFQNETSGDVSISKTGFSGLSNDVLMSKMRRYF